MTKISSIYTIFQVIIIGMILYGLLFAVLSSPENNVIQIQLPQCPYFKATNHYCPACGMTRDIHRMISGEKPIHNPYSLLFLIAVIAELALRLLTFLCRSKIKKSRFLMLSDMGIHAVLLVAGVGMVWWLL